MTNLHLRRLVATAVFLAISLILRVTVSAYLPLFGANGVRVGIHGVFSIMPAILFGPWYGAVASGLADLLGHFMRPSGAWLWQITIISTVGGFARGWMWRILRGRSPMATRGVIIVMTLSFLGFGAFSMLQLRHDGITRSFYDYVTEPSAVDTHSMSSMGRLVISRSQNAGNPAVSLSQRIAEVAYAPLGAGVFGLILLGVDMFLTKGLRKEDEDKLAIRNDGLVSALASSGVSTVVISGDTISYVAEGSSERGGNDSGLGSNKLRDVYSKWFAPWNGSIMPLALTIIIISLLINIANSIVLLWIVPVPAWSGFPFMYIMLPRAIAALLTSIVNVFIAVFLLKVCHRLPHLKKLMK